MTYVFLDCETTGLDPDRHEIWEIAYAVDDGPVESSCVRHEIRTGDPAALKISGYVERGRRGSGWWISADLWEIDLKLDLAGATLVGANPAFDASFLRARWGCAPWLYRLLDVETYAMPALGLDVPKGLNFIAEQLGVEAPDHTTGQDVETTRACFRELQRRYAPAVYSTGRQEAS